MNISNKNKKLNLSLSLIIFFIIFLIIAYYLPLTADDFSFSLRSDNHQLMKNFKDVVDSSLASYINWNGRIAFYFIEKLILLDKSRISFIIIYSLANTIIVYEIYELCDHKIISLYIFAAALIAAPAILLNQTLFWFTGWLTYVFPLSFLIPLISNTRKCLNNKEIKHFKLICFFSYFVCLFSEQYALLSLGFNIVVAINDYYSTKHLNRYTFYLLLASFLGCCTIFLTPGQLVRFNAVNADIPASDRIYFGYTRFIYCEFAVQVRILFLLGIFFVYYFGKDFIDHKNKLSLVNAILLIMSSLVLFIFIIKPASIPFTLREALFGEWTYYTLTHDDFIKYSSPAILLILFYAYLFLLCSIKEKNYLISIIYLASLCTNLIFIPTELACERTTFISYSLLIIDLALLVITYLQDKKLIIFSEIVLILIFGLESIKYINAYQRENLIFKENEKNLQACAMTNCKEVELIEHNYRYVFKSDFSFKDNFNWQMNAIRYYYGLDEKCYFVQKESK